MHGLLTMLIDLFLLDGFDFRPKAMCSSIPNHPQRIEPLVIAGEYGTFPL